MAGEKADSEKRRLVRSALYEGGRRSGETLAQYALRRESDFSQASQHIEIPDEHKGGVKGPKDLGLRGRGHYKASKLLDILGRVLDLDP